MAGQGGGDEEKYCFSHDHVNQIQTHHLVDQLQTFDQNSSEIYAVQSNHSIWKRLFFTGVHGGPSSSKPEFYDHHESAIHMAEDEDDDDGDDDRASNSVEPWQHQQHIVFPCEGNERPSQGLSLSLCSTNPSGIGLQCFEFRRQQQQQQDLIRFVPSDDHHDRSFFQKNMDNNDDVRRHTGQFDQIGNSRYLVPAQHLLSEICNLGTNGHQHDKTLRTTTFNSKPHRNDGVDDDEDDGAHVFCNSSSKKFSSLYSLDLLDLQKRKSRLLSLLEQLDRRYKHYCEQMKAVVSSFEAVAGTGAASVYSTMASKAMSRHFRCLRDGIVGQIKATKKAMGEKDIAAPGTTRGETPRLRVLDQTLRQQKAFQQMTLMETHPWRPQRGLPERSVSVLRAWLFEHFLHPYPSDVDKHILARQTGLSRSQVSNWFINARVRLWKPMVEEMYTEEIKEAQMEPKPESPSLAAAAADNIIYRKSLPSGQITRIDSDCLSSVINNATGEMGKTQMSLGNAVELDFSTYAAAAGGGGVSLTLELQQHHGGGNGVSLAFSPPTTGQSSLFYSREQMEECQPVHPYMLDGDQGQNLPYRFLMGAQLLNDLAG